MVSMALLGLGDSDISHATVVHEYAAFAQVVQQRATGEEQDAELVVSVRRSNGRVDIATKLDDYDHRPFEPEDYSSVLMLYESRPFDGASSSGGIDNSQEPSNNGSHRRPPPRAGTYLRYQEDHPFYSSHVLCRRQRPLLPRFCGEPPIQPTSNASHEDKEAWAAYFLGNFVPHRSSAPTPTLLYPAAMAWIAALSIPSMAAPADTNVTTGPMETHAITPTDNDPCCNSSEVSDPMDDDTSCCTSTSPTSEPMDEATEDPSEAASAAPLDAPSWAWHDVANIPNVKKKNIPNVDMPSLVPLEAATEQLLAPVCPHSVAQALRATTGQLPPSHLSFLLADNIDGRTSARKEIGASVHIRRSMQRTGLAVAARLPNVDPTTLHPEDEDDCSDIEDSDDPFTMDDALRGLEDSMDAAAANQDNHLRHGPLPFVAPASMPTSTAPSATYQCIDAEDVCHLGQAVNAAKARGKAGDMPQASGPPSDPMQFLSVRPTDNALEAVLYVVMLDRTGVAQTQQLHVIDVGTVPPFVLMDKLPTITETITLTRLNRKQALVFAFLAQRILDRNIGDLPAEQLLMLSTRKPAEQAARAFPL
jgi:hypothetical protein